MTQVFEQNHLNRFCLHLGTMVNEKPDRGLFVTTLGVCHITINYLNFLAKRLVQHIEHHKLGWFTNSYDPQRVGKTHCNYYLTTIHSFLEEVFLLS